MPKAREADTLVADTAHWLRIDEWNNTTNDEWNNTTNRLEHSKGLSSPGRRRKAEEEAKNKAKTNPK